jgi:hypothetical protein
MTPAEIARLSALEMRVGTLEGGKPPEEIPVGPPAEPSAPVEPPNGGASDGEPQPPAPVEPE